MSAFDLGGARKTQQCGLPDLRVRALSRERRDCRTCFSVHPLGRRLPAAIPDRLVDDHPRASKKVGLVWLDSGSNARVAADERTAWKRRGVKYVYATGIEPVEFNYVPYVIALREAGAKVVRFVGEWQFALRLAQTMRQEGYTPEAFVVDESSYQGDYLEQGGTAVRTVHSRVFLDSTPFEEKRTNPELRLYLRWLEQTAPGAEPTTVGLFAWSAARLFTETAISLGGDLTRARLVEPARERARLDLPRPACAPGRRHRDCQQVLAVAQGDVRRLGRRRRTALPLRAARPRLSWGLLAGRCGFITVCSPTRTSLA